MPPELALKLVVVIEAYFTADELRELAGLFEVDIEALHEYEPSWLRIAVEITRNLEVGNTRRFLDSLLDLADSRNSDGIAHTKWERQNFHREMASTLTQTRSLLESAAAPSEIAVPSGSVFSAKSRVRELLETATGSILIVDPYVGVGTLDCLRNLSVPIRLLTGTQQNSVESGFDRALADFRAEGHTLEVRRIQQLHDRHIVFNDRCWLVGGSLKDAGKKPFNCIEITDQKGVVVTDLESKWQAAAAYS